MERFEEKRKEALELYQQGKLTIVDHALERMAERNILYEDIESVLFHGSIYIHHQRKSICNNCNS